MGAGGLGGGFEDTVSRGEQRSESKLSGEQLKARAHRPGSAEGSGAAGPQDRTSPQRPPPIAGPAAQPPAHQGAGRGLAQQTEC